MEMPAAGVTGMQAALVARPQQHTALSFVMAGLVPAIHVFAATKTWMAGTEPGHDARRGQWFARYPSRETIGVLQRQWMPAPGKFLSARKRMSRRGKTLFRMKQIARVVQTSRDIRP
jgi:hypothetical protein